MRIDAKVIAAIGDMERRELIDVLDEVLGVGCTDEEDIDDLRNQVRTLYENGQATSEVVLNAYNGGL